MNIKDICQKNVETIGHRSTVVEALEKMNTKHINGMMVTNAAHKVVGVLSLQDIAAALVPREFTENTALADAMYKPGFFQQMCKDISTKQVHEIMRTDFTIVTPDTNIMEITADFLKNDLYIVPIIDRGNLIGVITRSELKHAIAQSMGISTT